MRVLAVDRSCRCEESEFHRQAGARPGLCRPRALFNVDSDFDTNVAEVGVGYGAQCDIVQRIGAMLAPLERRHGRRRPLRLARGQRALAEQYIVPSAGRLQPILVNLTATRTPPLAARLPLATIPFSFPITPSRSLPAQSSRSTGMRSSAARGAAMSP